MVLAIGIVVDDAIVVVENVERVMGEDQHLTAGRGDQQGDAPDHRADHRHLARAAVGVRAGGLHPRPVGHVVPPVRGHHQRRDADLGDQRADPVAGAVRGVPAPSRPAARPAGLGAGRHRPGARRLRRGRAPAGAGRRCSASCWSAWSAPAPAGSPRTPPRASCRRRTRARSSSPSSCRTAPRWRARRRWRPGSTDILKKMPQVQETCCRSSASRCWTAGRRNRTPPSWSCS